MLVLSRKQHERISVTLGGQLLWVSIVAIRGDKVRLGFEAPADALIHREEIWIQIQDAAAAAAAVPADPETTPTTTPDAKAIA